MLLQVSHAERGAQFGLEVDESMSMMDLVVLLECETDIPSADLAILCNGRILALPSTQTLSQMGLTGISMFILPCATHHCRFTMLHHGRVGGLHYREAARSTHSDAQQQPDGIVYHTGTAGNHCPDRSPGPTRFDHALTFCMQVM
jgi:hypothetical protein